MAWRRCLRGAVTADRRGSTSLTLSGGIREPDRDVEVHDPKLSGHSTELARLRLGRTKTTRGAYPNKINPTYQRESDHRAGCALWRPFCSLCDIWPEARYHCLMHE